MRSCGFFLSICGLLLLVVVSVGATPEVGTAFSQFKTEFGRSYHDVSAEAKRLAIFDANYRMIAEVNSRNLSYTLGINQFADMTQQEFAARFSAGGLQYPSALQASESSTTDSRLLGEMSAVPAEVDWREKGAVNPIRNQFQCGACWAFSANAAAESAWALANGTLTHMSEQQLVDCSQAQGNTGCNGGSMDFAFQYMQSAGPSKLCDGRNYKYVAQNGFCFASECKNSTGVAVNGFKSIPAGDETALQQAVGTIGVVSVGVQANQSGFQFYKAGVFNGTCGEQLDHAVAVVGYGSSEGADYWIVRNSWGTKWGEAGYMRMARGVNLCGVANVALYPTVTATNSTDTDSTV